MSRLRFMIGNISWTCSKYDLRSHFKKFAEVKDVQIVMNHETGFNRRFAFVRVLGDKEVADKIIQDYHVIDGAEVTVNLALEQQNDKQPQ